MVNRTLPSTRAALTTRPAPFYAVATKQSEDAMDETPVLVEKREGWWRLTLNRPDKLNSFNRAMRHALAAAVDAAARDEACRALLITGAGRGFNAGQDLADGVTPQNGRMPDLGQLLEEEYNPLVTRIRALPKPVIAAVNGTAAGGGANFALACDIVLAARSAKFIQAFVHIGLVPDVGGTWFLPRAVGDARARGLAMLGEPISGEQAAQWGLVWRAVDDDKLMAEAEALAARMAAMPTQAFAIMKRAFAASANNSLEQQLALERVLQRDAGNTPDCAEGISAFLEKRKPRFTGRKA
jgi:2-(1,2-epoxy-1,2-dihydrophenyl)acetyl-CoA isomerase